jgi:lambda family phage portal protein
MAIRVLRNRVREMARNNDYVSNALRAIQNNVVGNGVKMQSHVSRARGRGAGQMDTALNEAIEKTWKQWCRSENCHTAGKLCFSEIERVLIRAVAESGEVFVRFIRSPMGRSPVPLALEIIEADYLDENFNGSEIGNGNEIRMGIEVDKWQRPVAYHFFQRHPGDFQFNAKAPQMARIRVPASEIVHLYRTDRPDQTRGIPWFASTLIRLRHMSGFEEAEVIAARTSACQMGFLETPDPDFEADSVIDGERVQSFEPGKITTLAPGEKFTAFSPTRPSGLLDPFMRFMLRGVAAGVGVSYETLAKDYSQSNYSSSRLALLDDRDTWRGLQNWMIETFHQRVFESWLEMAVLSNTINLPGYEIDRTKYESVRWIPRGWAWVDPHKEITAYRTAVRAGFMTLTDVVAQNGGDLEEMLATRAREVELCDKLELIFDTDPEVVDGSGKAQPEPIEDLPDSPDDTGASNQATQSEDMVD